MDGGVNITDVNALVPQYNSTGNWTAGDFSYDRLVNITDVNASVPNYNQSLPAAAPSGAGQVSAAAVNASSTSSDSSVSGSERQSVLQGTTDTRKLRRARKLRI